MKSGFVSLVGRPNVGKSTILNAIMERKLAITSNVPGTTRNIIQGIYNDEDAQIIFVDTPGIHKPQDKLGKALNNQAYASLDGVDVIIFVTDITQKIGPGDKFILDYLKEIDIPVILVLNKIDKLTYKEILPKIDEFKDIFPFKEIVPISASKGKNITELVKTIKNYLNNSVKYYQDEDITNISNSFYISEVIREKILYLTRDEIPHSITCIVNQIEEHKTNTIISADIIVDRENLKKIIIGKNGSMIKKIGIEARKDIERLLNKNIYLDLKVKVVNNWRDKDSFIKDIVT